MHLGLNLNLLFLDANDKEIKYTIQYFEESFRQDLIPFTRMIQVNTECPEEQREFVETANTLQKNKSWNTQKRQAWNESYNLMLLFINIREPAERFKIITERVNTFLELKKETKRKSASVAALNRTPTSKVINNNFIVRTCCHV